MKKYILSYHNNVALKVIEKKWIGDWYEWKIKSPTKKMTILMTRIPLLPIIVVTRIFASKTARSQKWQIPVNRFISSVASYLVFLLFVFKESNIDKNEQLRGPPNSGNFLIPLYHWFLYLDTQNGIKSPEKWFKKNIRPWFFEKKNRDPFPSSARFRLLSEILPYNYW